ncbi:MAG: hypothetical protein WCO60_09325 [Verrucomicrobiota bacterium]
MKKILKLLPVFTCLCAVELSAAEAGKGKVIDNFNTIDPKSVKIWDLKAKSASTQDPAHRKVLEIAVDFAKPGTWPTVAKLLPPGGIDTKKYSGIRLSYKSDTETGMVVNICTGGSTLPDGRWPGYGTPRLIGKPEWQTVDLPFSAFKDWANKAWVNGEQKIYAGGQPIRPEDYGQFKELRFTFDINFRGTASTGIFLIDGLELIPN